MDQTFLQEVTHAVELSLRGDKESVTRSNQLLGEDYPKRQGYLPALLKIAADVQVRSADQLNLGVRKAAAIIFGKELKFNWKRISEDGTAHSEADKNLVRAEIFPGMLLTNEQSVIKLLGHALYSVVLKEAETWEPFEDRLFAELVNNPTIEKVYCSLVALHSICKVKQYYIDEDRAKVSKTAAKFLPTLLELGKTLLAQFTLNNALLIKEVIKIFYRIIKVLLSHQIDLDPYLRTPEVNDAWMDFINTALTSSIIALRDLQTAKADESLYTDNPYWNILKWSLRIYKRYSFVYGEPDKEKDEVNKPFARHWMNKYSVPLWEMLVDVLVNRKVIRVPQKIIKELITCLQYLLDSEAVDEKHKGGMEKFLFEDVLDLVRFTKEDEELFQDNPVEYFRINDENNHDYSVAGHALNIFGKCFKQRGHLKAFMKFVGEALATKANPRTKQPVTVIDIEAFFHIIEAHSMAVLRIKNIAEIMSGLLANFVQPELQSEHGFMRMRACKMVTMYGSAVLKPELLKTLSDGVIKCMTDKDLPVRSCAAQALETLLKQKDLRDYFLPNLAEILKVYVLLVNEFENETLIASLKGIFEMYSEVIGPYAVDLVRSLVELFFKCLEKERRAEEEGEDNSKNDKEMMESGFACQGCLSAIEEVLRSSLDKSLLPTLYTLVEPILEQGFHDSALDYLSEIAAILNTFIYSFEQLPDGIWAWFVVVCHSVVARPQQAPDFPAWVTDNFKKIYNELPTDDFASEFFLDLNQVLRNFVNKGFPSLFEKKDFFGVRLFDLLLHTLVEVIRKNLPHEYEFEQVAEALTTVGFVFAQLPGKLDAEIPRLLDISIDALQKKFNQLTKECFIHNLGFALWNNTTATLEYLSSKGMLADVLANWPAHHSKASTYRIRKGSFLGMMSLFSLSVEQLQAAQVPIIQLYVEMANSLPKLARDQERILNDEFQDSDFDEDDGMGGFSDDDEDKIDLDADDVPEPTKKATNKKLDHRIQKTREKLAKLEEEEAAQAEQAKEALSEIESKIFNDNADKMNEVLLFESTVQSSR